MSSLLRQSVVFASSRYVLLGLSVVRNFAIARILSPDEYGWWVLVSLVLTYGDQAHLGLRHAGDKEIPLFQGRGEHAGARTAAARLQGGILLLAALAMVGTALWTLLDPSIPVHARGMFLGAALILFSDQLSRYYLMLLRATQQFITSSKIEVAFEFLRTVLVCLLAVSLRVNGVVVAFLVASLCTSLFFIVRRTHSAAPSFEIAGLAPLFAIGIPLYASGLGYIVLTSLDRIAVAWWFPKEQLGVYGFASLVAQLPMSASLATSAVLYPRFSELFGRHGTPTTVFDLFRRSVVTVSALSPILVASLAIVAEFLIPLVLPAYESAIPLVRALTPGVFFFMVFPLSLYVLMSLGLVRLYLLSQGAILVLALIPLAVLPPAADTMVVARAMAGLYALSGLVLFGGVAMTAKRNGRSVSDATAQAVIPLLFGAVLFTALSHLIGVPGEGGWSAAAAAAGLKLLLFSLLYVPILVWLRSYWVGVVSELLLKARHSDAL